MYVYSIQWEKVKMLNFNFLNNFKYWGEALQVIERRMPHKLTDFRQSLEQNNMDASIWLVEELKNYIWSQRNKNLGYDGNSKGYSQCV